MFVFPIYFPNGGDIAVVAAATPPRHFHRVNGADTNPYNLSGADGIKTLAGASNLSYAITGPDTAARTINGPNTNHATLEGD